MVHIHGPAGSGKSALLHEFCTTAVAGGATVLTAACARAEREDPLATVRQLLESAHAGGTAAGLGCVDPLAGATESDALVGGAMGLARDRPVVIAVDDVRHADSESVRHLLAVACRAPWARILIVLTERTSSGNERSALHDELLGTSAARTVGVTNLSVGGALSLLAEYEVAIDASGAEHHWWATGGNPLLLHALAPSLLRRSGNPSAGVCLPGSQHSPDFRTVVRKLIRSLDQPEVEVLRAVAVLSGSAAGPQGVLGMPIARLARVVDALERVGLLEACRFRDPTVLDEVRADMTDGEQIKWHLRAAEYLLREHAPATAVAAHLVNASRVPYRRMVDVLVDAATELLAAGDAHEAKRCLDLARRSGPDAGQAAEIEVALVRVEHQIAPSSAARRLPSVLSAIPDDRLHSEPIAELLEMACWYCGPDAGGEMLARLASAPVGDGRTPADLETSQMLPTTIFPGIAVLPRSTAADGEPGLGSFRFTGGFRNDLLAFARSVLNEGWTERAAQQSVRLLTSVDLHARDARVVFVALTVMALVGHPVSPSVCDRLIDAADDRGLIAAKAMFLAARADVNLARGHVAAAEHDARAALDTMPAEGWGVGIGQPVAALQRAITESGRAAATVEPLSIPMPEAMFESVFGLPYLYARGAHLLALRQPRAALDHFRSCGLVVTRWGLSRDVAPWRYGAARALVALGDERGARELLNDQLAELPDGINRGLALRMLASLSSHDTALRLLAEAQSLFDLAGNGLESARTLAKISELHDRRGERTTARVNRARARKLAQDVGVPRLVDEFASSSTPAAELLRLAPVAASHGGTAVLTDAESRVVELVVRGHTNREISGHLFVTVSTVEQHLTSVFRKLKVKRRRELAAVLAGRGPTKSSRDAVGGQPSVRVAGVLS